jgi:hypothetical protein
MSSKSIPKVFGLDMVPLRGSGCPLAEAVLEDHLLATVLLLESCGAASSSLQVVGGVAKTTSTLLGELALETLLAVLSRLAKKRSATVASSTNAALLGAFSNPVFKRPNIRDR